LKYLINNASKKVSDYLNETRRQAGYQRIRSLFETFGKAAGAINFYSGLPVKHSGAGNVANQLRFQGTN
jgi:hypothetical protein